MMHHILLFGILATALAQQYTTPIPILKQINRHNEDGSYSYGYEGADGSYKIESKYPSGEVFGKYGYVDDSGKLREIEYGASKRGFEPQGNEINVAPPTINNNYPVKPLGPNEEDDGQYREDPSIYYKNEKYNESPQPTYQPAYQNSYGPRNTQPTYQKPQEYQPNYQQPAQHQPAFRPATKYSFDDFIQNRPQPNHQQNYYNPPTPAPVHPTYNNYHSHNQFAGHPATNVDYHRGSYSVNYR